MNNAELLKNGRDLLLKLHKTLVDHERRIYEGINGTQSSGQFLNVLLEDPDFAWLRKFSTLIVEIDEMFDLKDGYEKGTVDLLIEKLKDLVSMKDGDEAFKAKYQSALQQDLDVAAHQGSLKELLK